MAKPPIAPITGDLVRDEENSPADVNRPPSSTIPTYPPTIGPVSGLPIAVRIRGKGIERQSMAVTAVNTAAHFPMTIDHSLMGEERSREIEFLSASTCEKSHGQERYSNKKKIGHVFEE